MNSLFSLALQTWCETTKEGLLVSDLSGNISILNRRLRDMLRLTSDLKTVDELFAQTERTIPALRSLFAESGNQERWGSLVVQKQPVRNLTWNQVPLYDDQQALTGLMTIFHDGTGQGQLEFAKQSFLSMISHDLRTPLSTILGFAELLYHNRGSLADEEQKEFLEHIIKNANQLSQYTQVALDIMFLEANLQSFDLEAVYLDTFVKQWLADALHRYSSEKLVYQNGTTHDPMARIAPAAMHKILYILIEFALAESPTDDPVRIRLSYDQQRAHVTVVHRAPDLTKIDVEVLFKLMESRDLSEAGRPKLHRMQLYVASLLAQRQEGYLTLRAQDNQFYQLDLAVPLVIAS